MKKKEIINRLKRDLHDYGIIILEDERYISMNDGKVCDSFKEVAFARQCIHEYIMRTLKAIED